MKMSFKQFNTILTKTPEELDESVLNELFGLFKKDEDKLSAYRKKQEELKKKVGDAQYARMQKQKAADFAKAKQNVEGKPKAYDKKPSNQMNATRSSAAERDWVRQHANESVDLDTNRKI